MSGARNSRDAAPFEPLQALAVGVGVLVAVTVLEVARGTALSDAWPRAMGFAVPFAIVWAGLSAWRAGR